MTEINVLNENTIKMTKSRENGDSIQDELGSMVEENEILLFMKGNRLMPHCGFSAQVINLLAKHTDSFVTVDVLADQEIRKGIKEFSNWPTIPQLYVKGKFIGGCDIITELHEEGELEAVLKG